MTRGGIVVSVERPFNTLHFRWGPLKQSKKYAEMFSINLKAYRLIPLILPGSFAILSKFYQNIRN
jgi:hypothetical protein